MIIRDTECRRCGKSILASSGPFSNRMPDNICEDCKKKQQAQTRFVWFIVILALTSVVPYFLARYVHVLVAGAIPLIAATLLGLMVTREGASFVKDLKEYKDMRTQFVLICAALIVSITFSIIGFVLHK